MNTSTPSAKELNVSRETLEKLEAYVALLRIWAPKINLVARPSLQDVWSRHVKDSLQLYQLAGRSDGEWADLGSGAGLPGLVLAIAQPGIQMTLVESDKRKAVFLRTCTRELGLTIEVLSERAEVVPPLASDLITARALAPLDQLLSHVFRHLGPDGVALLPKGKMAMEEVAKARKKWSFTVDAIPSLTNPEGKILRIERICRV